MIAILRLSTLCLLLASVLVWNGESAAAESTLDKVKRTGEMLAGVRSDNPPMAYRDEQGNWAGFAVDIARAVADKLGVKPIYVGATAQTRVPLLTSGRIDAEFGSTTVTKQREEVVDFTMVYVWDSASPLVRMGESKVITDYSPPKKVATTQGNLGVSLFKAQVPNGEVVLFPEFPEAVLALLNKKVDAVLVPTFAGNLWAKKYPGQLQVGEPYFLDPEAIMVRQDDSKWRNTLNWILQELWAEGRFQKIYEKYFGYPPNFPFWSYKGLQPGIVK